MRANVINVIEFVHICTCTIMQMTMENAVKIFAKLK